MINYVNYDWLFALIQQASEQLDYAAPAANVPSKVREAVYALGIVVPVLREVEKILRVPLDDIEGLKTVDRMLGCRIDQRCGTDEMQMCLQCRRRRIAELEKWLHRALAAWCPTNPGGDGVDGETYHGIQRTLTKADQ